MTCSPQVRAGLLPPFFTHSPRRTWVLVGSECPEAVWTGPQLTQCACVSRIKVTPKPREGRAPGTSPDGLCGRPGKAFSMHTLRCLLSWEHRCWEGTQAAGLPRGFSFSSATFWRGNSRRANFLNLSDLFQHV